MRKIQNPKSVLQLTKDGSVIKKWDSASWAAKELGLFVLSIKNCCEQKKYVKSVGGFIWVYEENKDNINMNYYFNINSHSPKPVIQLDVNMNFVKRWESISKINKELGLDTSSLSMVCNYKRKSCGGYVWIFEENYIA